MGLIDVLNGLQNGPRGAPRPGTGGSGGMSKTTMALLAFLAYKAYKNLTNSQPAQAGGASRVPGGRLMRAIGQNRKGVSRVSCAPSSAAAQFLVPC
jgi:hypothetical protein